MQRSSFRNCEPQAIRVYGKDQPAKAVWFQFAVAPGSTTVEIETTPENAELFFRHFWKAIKALRGQRSEEVTQIKVEAPKEPDLQDWQLREDHGFMLAVNIKRGAFVVARDADQRTREMIRGGTLFAEATADEVTDFWQKWAGKTDKKPTVERCYACSKPLDHTRSLVVTSDCQQVYVGPDCFKKIWKGGKHGYQPPLGGPRLFADPFGKKPEEAAKPTAGQKAEAFLTQGKKPRPRLKKPIDL